MSQDRKIKWLNDRRIIYRRDPINDKPTIKTKQYMYYENGTYVTLDSISGIVTTDWIQPGYNSSGPSEYANDNFNIGKEYNLSTIGAYKYYVLYLRVNNT